MVSRGSNREESCTQDLGVGLSTQRKMYGCAEGNQTSQGPDSEESRTKDVEVRLNMERNRYGFAQESQWSLGVGQRGVAHLRPRSGPQYGAQAVWICETKLIVLRGRTARGYAPQN